jgi:hypothetical protein
MFWNLDEMERRNHNLKAELAGLLSDPISATLRLGTFLFVLLELLLSMETRICISTLGALFLFSKGGVTLEQFTFLSLGKYECTSQ